MAGVATETHPMQGGVSCSQFYDGNYSNCPMINISNFTYDVTDNRTDTIILPSNIKTFNTMNDIFHREDERLKTFDTWPIEWIDKYQLALTGMFYTGDADKVKCYFCEVEIGRWEPDDQPLTEHIRWSHNCPLLRRRTTNNVPINAQALEQILPPISYDVCGANDTIEVRPNAHAEGSISSARLTNSTSVSNCLPEYPEYAIEAARLRSFAEWPRHMKQKPEQLAEAGFFYTGVGDRVKCYSCGGGLKDWDESDEPWEQHAKWLNKCRYLKLMKGQTFIDAVIDKQKVRSVGEIAEREGDKHSNLNEAIPPKPATIATATTTITTTTTNNNNNNLINNATNTEITECNNCDVNPEDAALLADDEQSGVRQIRGGCVAPAAVNTIALEKKSNSNIPEEKLCKICYAGEYNTAFLPCGHVVACAKCASSVTKCPLCRKPFTDVMRVYFS